MSGTKRTGVDDVMEEQGGPDLKNARRHKGDLKGSDVTNRLPPHDPNAELAVLGSILLSPKDSMDLCIEKLGSSEAFYSLQSRTVYEAMLGMHADGVPIDVISLRSELADLLQLEQVGGLQFLAGLPDATPAASHIGHYLDILVAKHTLRKAIALATEVATRAQEHQGDVDGLLEDIDRDFRAILDAASKGDTIHTASEMVKQSMDWAESSLANKGKTSGIPTGFVDFDRLTGGLQNSEMIVIAARPSTGKSSWCMNVADYVAVNLNMPVAVFSLEMSALSLFNRTVCSRARVSMSRVRDGEMYEADYGKIATAFSSLKKAPLYIDDASGTSITQLQAKARRYHDKYGLKLLIIDYLQLMTSSNKRSESRQQEVTEISAGIKALAKDLNIPVIVASQLNREVEKDKKNRKPRMSDIRESGAIENDADLIGFLYKPNEEEEKNDGPESSVVHLLIGKNRNGRVGQIPLVFLKSITRFESTTNTPYDNNTTQATD